MPKNEIDKVLRGAPDWKKPVFGKVDHALELQKLISEHIVNMHVESQNIIKQDAKPASGKEDHDFVVELLCQYSDLMWKVNDNNQTIFHITIINRHEGIYNIIYEIGSMKDSITSLEDENGNNMLHLVAKIANKNDLEWWQGLLSRCSENFFSSWNKDGLTPHELFTKEHEDLRAQSEAWMKETANQCMVVAALIATIVFAAAFTIPGGYNQNNGIPMFFENLAFMIFVVSDAISLFSSSASTIMFMTILTSRFTEPDFFISLPQKLLCFLITLFISITTMMIAFSVSFIILYRTYRPWIVLIISFCVLQVLLFAKVQYPVIINIFHSTYSSRYLFRPKKNVLYYEIPKV
ncbi:ankyrin repeat-containing domain, PGG domain protein [Artemisia annua]|uniref:Ankyrin repeat-containing domain, PGG domain protein n=1 Tax=Artemisia annua TaxID=35608 RepID=A0A2U1LBE3_ARTAN|nr:ankyrin repeat-containing domain, PGG domain protein [Artemisia annua]